KCFSVGFRISFVSGFGPCYLGTATPEARLVTRGSQFVKQFANFGLAMPAVHRMAKPITGLTTTGCKL
ncbi:MAG: hypothetical protein ACYS19_20565, partial [Planctomycetota bacterium]